MLTTVEGVYKEGHIELSETPEGVQQARVLVTFLSQNGAASDEGRAQTAPRYLRRGQFAGPIVTEEEDFRMAEWGDDKIPEEFR